MQTGLYGYNNSSDSSSDSDHSNSPEEGVQSSSRPDLAPECIVTTGDNSESPTSQAGQRQQEPIDPVELELPEDTQVPASQDSRALIDKVETEREQQGDAGTCSTADDVASLQAKRRRLAAEFLMKKRQQAQQQ
ncbi:hypothetical protein GGH92_010442 [Coemansia sp. RSA 2673]|nr:hypothetical protein GGH92_010442 [Coemansia sp. RSA 2673]